MNSHPTADVLLVIDESSSLSSVHSWITSLATALETRFLSIGMSANRYSVVGFASSEPSHTLGHTISVDGNDFYPVAGVARAVQTLAANGRREDGYCAINTALRSLATSPRSDAALVVILITDEDRDILCPQHTFNTVYQQLLDLNAVLHVVATQSFTLRGQPLFGVDYQMNGYFSQPSSSKGYAL